MFYGNHSEWERQREMERQRERELERERQFERQREMERQLEMQKESRKKLKKRVTIGVAGAVAGMVVCASTATVRPGYAGVVYDRFRGGVQSELLTEGINFKTPWSEANFFTIATEVKYMSKDSRKGSKDDESINLSCKDGSLNADISFNYRFNIEDIVKLQKKFRGRDGNDIINIVLDGQLRGWVSEVTKNYTTMEVHLTNKSEVNAKLTEHINKRAKEYGLTFENVTLAETRASDEVQKAIEDRQKVSQELEKQKLKLEQLELQKQEAILEAERKKIEAEGEREANKIKAEALPEAILIEKAIKKWNGEPAPTMKVNN